MSTDIKADDGTIDSNNNELLNGNMPKKKFFRSRAHCNPLSHNDGFNYPLEPNLDVWQPLYPNINKSDLIVRHLDIGMGFGGLTIALAKTYPNQLVLGMEIRAKVCEYVRLRILGLRKDFPCEYENAACIRTNCMRYLPNFFNKQQLHKIFICFPDPHFKHKNHRRRIISYSLLSEYAYLLAPKGRLYTITDVEELHNWHVEKCSSHYLFRRLNDEEVDNDEAVGLICNETEEGIKVSRLNGKKFFAVFERLDDIETSHLSPIDNLLK
eukprot:gene17616-23191_t